MRLAKIDFTNFRCFSSETIEFSSFTSLVGPNNCGKSTALRALSIFFGGGGKANSISAADFYIGAALDDILTLRFEFSDVVGDAAADLSHYVRNERVVFELSSRRNLAGEPETHCRGIRYGLERLAPFFAVSTAGARRPIYDELRQEFPADFPAWQNMSQAEAAVRAFEAARAEDHVPIPSSENAYGATGPVPILKRYMDWIYIPAVKDASTEATEMRDSAFSKLILFAVRNRHDFSAQINELVAQASNNLRGILEGANDALTDVGRDIDSEFKNLTTTPIDVAIDWDQIKNVQISEPAIRSIFRDGRVSGAPEAFGHGLQRTYLVALLSLAARIQKDNDDFRLLLGIEEPELYQHPPQSRFLSSALADLSEGNCQVVLTTHSPTFVSGRTFESIRVLRKRENSTHVHFWTIDEQRAYCAVRKQVAPIGAAAALSGLDRSLQTNVSELFFAARVVLVEGAKILQS